MFDTRRFLLIVGSLYVALGAIFLFFPAATIGFVDVSLGSPAAHIEIQGFYGGQMIGLGALIVFAAMRAVLMSAGLLVVIASLGGTALGRLFGAMMVGELPLVMAALVVVEAGTAGFATALALRRQP